MTAMSGSYDLLEESRKTLLARLCVFAGGGSLEAIEAVCCGGGVEAQDVPDALTTLVEKSLVNVEAGRYRMPETVREDAVEKLAKSGEKEAIDERHRDYFLMLAEDTDAKLNGAEQGALLSRLETEHANLRSALSWSLQQEGGGMAALRLCGALQTFWRMRGHIEEGRQWCEAALKRTDAADRSAERARVLNGTGVLARLQGDDATARAYHEQSLAIRRAIGDQKAIAASLNGLGNVASGQGDYAAARACYEESLAIKRALGDEKSAAGSLNNLGFVAYHQGDYPTAGRYYAQSLTIRRDLGNMNTEAIASTLEGLAEVSAAEGDWERGVRLWGMVEALRERIGASRPPKEQDALDQNVAAARQALGEEAFLVAWATGGAMTLDQALAYALEKQE